MSLPLGDLSGPVTALFTDVDGTMTTNGRVEAATYAALEDLGRAGVPVIMVTGRPAGWGQAFMTIAPVKAVVAENGGVTFVRRGGKLQKIYGVPAATLPEWRRRMQVTAVDVMNEVHGARLSTDSKYREVDLAIDWNEECSLAVEDAERIVGLLRKQGFAATRSSVHVNFGPPELSKLSACLTLIEEVFEGDRTHLDGYVFVGDALNDASMFAGLPKSVGVANVRRWWNELPHKPTYVTEAEEGAGLRELVAHLLTLVGAKAA